MKKSRSHNILTVNRMELYRSVVSHFNQRRSLRSKGGLKVFLGASFLVISILFFNNNSYSQGYTTPVDANSNGIYDFQEAGSVPVISTQPTDSTICANVGASFNVTATGSDLIYQWQVSTDSGSNYSNISTSGSTQTYAGFTSDELTLSGTTIAQDGYFYRVIVYSETYACDSVISSVADLTVNALPSAPSASNQTFCGTSPSTVADLFPSGAGFQWYLNPTGGSPLVGATSLVAGNYYVSETNSGCESPRTSINVTINFTIAPTAIAHVFCSVDNPTVSDFTVAGNAVQYYSLPTGGTVLSGATSLTSGTYYATQAVSGCESPRSSFAVTIVTTPAQPTASNQEFCSIESHTIGDLNSSAANDLWYNVSSGGTALINSTVLISGTYYVADKTGICESSRTAIDVTITPTPAAPSATANQDFCTSDSHLISDLSATGTNIQWYSVSTGGSVLAVGTTLATGTYYVSQSNGACESSRTAVSVTINTTPAAPSATANQDFCTSDSHLVSDLVATGTNLQWYIVPSGGSALGAGTTLVTGNYYASQSNGTCESTRTQVDVTINTTPSAPSAPATQDFCTSDSHLVSDLSATGTSLQWYTVSTGGSALAVGTTLATGNYYVSQTVGGCESARTTVSVTINTTPSAPSAPATQDFCTSDSHLVSDLSATGTSLQWYSVPTGGSALAVGTTLATGTYYVSQTTGSCESARTTVSVTINTTPSAPSATANQDFCTSDSHLVSDLSATGTSLQWYTVSSGGSALALGTTLVTGNYYVSQTVGSCESARTTVSVTINTTPTAPSATANQDFCTSDSHLVSDLTATGTSLQWYSVPTGGSALAVGTTLATGTFYVSQTTGSCESARTTVSVTINTTPAAPSATANQDFCTSDSHLVSDLSATGTSLQWYTVSSGGSALALGTTLATGNYYVSQTVGGCESARTTVSVTINTTPSAPSAPATQDFCDADSHLVSDLTVAAITPNWYNVPTGGSPLASGTVLMSGSYYVTETVVGCESVRTEVIVNVSPTPSAPNAVAQDFCSDENAEVSDLVATGTNLSWYGAAIGGTPLSSSDLLATGQYYVSQTVGSCESSRSMINVTVTVSPPAPSSSDQDFCDSDSHLVSDLVATGTNLLWYAVSSGGTPLLTGTTLSTGTYYVSQTVGSCESPRTSVNVIVNAVPLAPSASGNQDFCSADNPVVSDLTATGTGLLWYTVSTGGTPLAVGATLTTTNYYVSQTIGSCESARTIVAVEVFSTPGIPSSGNQDFCSGDSPVISDLSVTGSLPQWYENSSGGSPLAPTTILTSDSYYVTQTVDGCESPRLYIDVTVHNTPVLPVASSPQSFCTGSSYNVSDLSATGTNLQWYNVSTGGTPMLVTDVITSGSYYVTQTINGCESNRLQVDVTINDTEDPVVTCNNFTLLLDNTGSATLTSANILNVVTDNCSTPTLTINQENFTCADLGSNSITLTAEDNNSNIASCTANVLVEDNTNPIAICQDVNLVLDVNGLGTVLGADVNNGSTDACGPLDFTLSKSDYDCSDLGSNNVILTVTDGSLNNSTCNASVNVVDNINPVAICQDITIALDATGNASIVASDIDNGSNDGCNSITSSINLLSFDCSNIGPNNVELTVTDQSSNTSTCTSNVTVEDNINPGLTCQDITVYLDASGVANFAPTDLAVFPADNCGTSSMTAGGSMVGCSEVGFVAVNVTAVDVNGNSISCTSNVTVSDTIAPSVTCNDYVLQLDGSGDGTLLVGDVATGISDACGIQSSTVSTDTFDSNDIGINTVTIVVTDNNSNTTSCTSLVTIDDDEAPMAICNDTTLYLDNAGIVSITDQELDNGSTDNVGVSTWSASTTSFSCGDIGSNTLTLTVGDSQGNSATCSSQVTVIDNIAPTALCLDITVGLDNDDEANVVAASVNNGSSDNCGIQSMSLSQNDFYHDDYGANNVTLTVTDVNGLVSTCVAIITISNSNPPNAICQDTTIYLDAAGTVTILDEDIDGGSTDNGTIDIYVADQTVFTCLDLGENPISLTITDNASNSNSCSALVTVLDTINPVVSCNDITLSLDNSGTENIIQADIINTATDNCDSLTYSLNISTVNCADLGDVNVLLTAEDLSGNFGTCTSIVTVEDITAPVGDVVNLPTITDECSVNLTAPTATDNCSGTVTATTIDPTSYSSQGTYTVNWTYTDAEGNVSSQVQNVIIDDVTGPIPDESSLIDITESCSVISITPPTATDNCGAIITGSTAVVFPITLSTVVTWNFDDGNGNITSQDQNVIVNDTIDPVIPTLADITGECSATAIAPTTSDNCAGIVTGSTSDPLTYSSVGIHVITWTFDDGNGNIITVNQNVIVTDTSDPDIPILLDVIEDCSAVVSVPTTNDNCAGLIFGTTSDPLNYDAQGDYVINWTFDDGNGNLIDVNQNVTINDVTVPTAICQDTTVIMNNITNDVTIDTSYIDNGSIDACGISSVELSDTVFGPIGIYPTTLIVEDVNGNVSTCVAQVNVVEALDAPIAQCQDISLSLQNDGTISMSHTAIDNGSFDNSAIFEILASQTDFTCAHLGDNLVTLTVEDDEGNFGQCEATVTVIDEIAPTIICQNVTIYLDANGHALINNLDVLSTFNDNCGSTNIILSQSSFDGDNLGDNNVDVEVTDDSGNMSTCLAIVNVIDSIAPDVVCNDLIVPLDASGSATVTINELGAGTSDNHDFIFGGETFFFDCSEIGDSIYALSAFDLSGNVSTCTGTISIVDDLAPTISCQDFVLELDDLNQGSISISDVQTDNSDNCGIDSLSLSQYDFDENNIGSNDVIVTAVDVNGNTSTCIAIVQVNSTLPPEAICQDITVSLDSNGEVSIIAADVDGGSTDPNGQVSLTISNEDFTCADIGDNTVTMTVENIFNVTASCEANVFVVDDMSPILTCPTDKLFPNDLGQCGAIVDYGPVSSDDNCAVSLELINGALSNTFFDVGTTSVEYKATDLSGNETFCSFNVEITDSEAPIITCPEDIYTSEEIVIYDAPAFDDNCSAELVQVEGATTGSAFNHGFNPQTYIATDNAGLSSECSFMITVNNEVVAVNDSVTGVEGINIAIDALFNDYDPDGDDFNIISASSSRGEVMIVEGKEIVYIPENDWCGTDSVFYEIQDIYGSRSTALIYVEVACEVQVFVPEGFSPNNDGVNDFFEIVGIENYPQAELNIYNRWSHIIYESKEYDNSWDGTTTNPLTLGKKIVPIGTYFYNLKIDNETIIKGYFYISR